ncbi:MAG: hypothetical protein PHO89_08060 [Methylacidiphilaceae bacterium]|nr:hypothetical protein [Candidatus Methylacidiphilaceae bacterium]
MVWSRKRLWLVGGMGLLATALAALFAATHPGKKMISPERVREIFSGKGAPMTADDFFGWIEFMRRNKPHTVADAEKLLGIRFSRLTPKEDFVRTEGIEELKYQGPDMEKKLEMDAKTMEIGLAEWPAGPWKELTFTALLDTHTAEINFILRPEIALISKKEMIHHLGRPGLVWDSPRIMRREGKLFYPEGITAKNFMFVYEADGVSLNFEDPDIRDVIKPHPLVSGSIGM